MDLTLTTHPSRLLGRWQLLSGDVGRRSGSGSGVTLELQASGALVITLSRAFLNPISDSSRSFASQVGVSGLGHGRWAVTSPADHSGAGTLQIFGLSIAQLTIHPRRGLKFALPAPGLISRVEDVLADLNGEHLGFSIDETGALTLSGRVRGYAVVLRLKPA